jgi:hypothetical protein
VNIKNNYDINETNFLTFQVTTETAKIFGHINLNKTKIKPSTKKYVGDYKNKIRVKKRLLLF